MTTYFTSSGPKRGPWLYRDAKLSGAIGVLQVRDNRMPIGMALGLRWTDEGIALWELTVRGVKLPGRWIVVDGLPIAAEKKTTIFRMTSVQRRSRKRWFPRTVKTL